MKLLIYTDQGALFRECQELAKQALPSVSLCRMEECACAFRAPPFPLPDTDVISHATAQAQACRLPLLIEASSLIVPSLRQRYPCRLPVEEQSEHRRRLLHAFEQQPLLDRSAYMECILTYADPDGKTMQFKGICEGVLLEEEQGNGFGYDPLFRKHDYNQTLAQVPPHIKRAISPLAKAFERFALWLESSLSMRR